jgi:plasmid maintenance system antidote protein VapI
MKATLELLQAFKTAKRITSDNAAAIALGTTRQAISNWRRQDTHASPATVEKMADAIGENPAKWVMRIAADSAANENDRKAWLRCAQRVAAVALTLATLTAPALLHAADTAGSLPIV